MLLKIDGIIDERKNPCKDDKLKSMILRKALSIGIKKYITYNIDISFITAEKNKDIKSEGKPFE